MHASHDPRLAVGLIGLGNMGTAIAERLLDAGYELVVFNRTPAKAEPLAARGATVAGTAADVAGRVEVVLTSLADDEAFEAVAADVVDAAPPGTVLVDMSTVSPAASARVAARAEAASVAYLRAPVSGNPTVVRAGNLSFIVSGPRETLERVESVLRAIGPTVHHVGDGEQARIVKLAINLDDRRDRAVDVRGPRARGGVRRLARRPGRRDGELGRRARRSSSTRREPLLRDDYSATFTTTLMEKDIDLVLDAADEAGVELPVTRELKTLLRGGDRGRLRKRRFHGALPVPARALSDREVVR